MVNSTTSTAMTCLMGCPLEDAADAAVIKCSPYTNKYSVRDTLCQGEILPHREEAVARPELRAKSSSGTEVRKRDQVDGRMLSIRAPGCGPLHDRLGSPRQPRFQRSRACIHQLHVLEEQRRDLLIGVSNIPPHSFLRLRSMVLEGPEAGCPEISPKFEVHN